MTLNRFTAQSSAGGNSGDAAEAKKKKEASFVATSQVAAKAIQHIMVWLKDARTNVSDPNRICDKALSEGLRITNLVVPFIKTIQQVVMNEDGAAHHVLQLIPSDANKIHDTIGALTRLVDTWVLTSKANTSALRNKAPQEVFTAVKEMAAQAIVQVKALSDAVINQDGQEFAKRAKEVAVLLSKLIKHAQNRKWQDMSEALLKDAQSLISAGKTAVKNKEAQKDFYQVVGTSVNNIKQLLRFCKADSEGKDVVTGLAVSPSLATSQGSAVTVAALPRAVALMSEKMAGFQQLWQQASEREKSDVLEALQGVGSLSGSSRASAMTPNSKSSRDSTAFGVERSPSRTSFLLAGAGEEVATEADLVDVELGFADTLRDMQQWYERLRAPFRFWAPNFDKTDYESIIDRSTPDGMVIASMVQAIDELAGCTFLFIVNANLCLSVNEGGLNRTNVVKEPAELLQKYLLQIAKYLSAANNNNAKDSSHDTLENTIQESLQCLEGDSITAHVDQVTVQAASGLFVARLVAASLKSKLYHDCNRLRVSCIHLCSVLASLRKYSSLLPHQIMQIACGLRLCGEQMKEVMSTVATQIAVIERVEEETSLTQRQEMDDASAEVKAKTAEDEFSDMLDARSQQALEFLSQRMEKKAVVKTMSIWRDADDTNVIFEDKAARKGVRAANLNKLVQELTSTVNYDTSYVQTFVATYQSFTTPDELFNKLMERYDVPSGMDQKLRQQIRLRVAIVVKHWVEHQFADFDQNIITRLYDLCKRLESDGQIPMSQALHKLILKKDEARLAKLKSYLSVPPTDLQIPSGYVNPSELFMVFSPKDIAEQMTILDFSWFAAIAPRELLNQCWSKPKLQYRAGNVLGLINRVNILSYWVPSLILWPEKLSQRIKVFEKFIKVASFLRKLGNFSALMAVLIGLGQSATSRLNHTKNALSAESKKLLSELETVMNPQKSFSNYRSALRACKPPSIPYLGVYLQDLTFIEDGNPEQIDGLVNFERLGLVYGVLKEVLLYQNQSYAIPVLEPMSTLLISLPFATEKNLYQLSLIREPRGETDVSKIK